MSWQVLFQQKEMRICFVTTPRSLYGCGKCGAWLFGHKLPVPFTLREHVKTTKPDKLCFFFAKKDEIGTRQRRGQYCPNSIK